MFQNWDEGIHKLLKTLIPESAARGDWEHPVSVAILGITSKDPAARVAAARVLWNMRDPGTVPLLVKVMSEEIGPTLTKVLVMRTLRALDEKAVPALVSEVREHAQLVEKDDPVDLDAWRAAVVESDAGRLLINIGASSKRPLEEVGSSEGPLLSEAAIALLRAIEERQTLESAVLR